VAPTQVTWQFGPSSTPWSAVLLPSPSLAHRVHQTFQQATVTTLSWLIQHTPNFSGWSSQHTMAPQKAAPSKKDGIFLPFLGPPPTTVKPLSTKRTKATSSTPMDTDPPTAPPEAAVVPTAFPHSYAVAASHFHSFYQNEDLSHEDNMASLMLLQMMVSAITITSLWFIGVALYVTSTLLCKYCLHMYSMFIPMYIKFITLYCT